MSDKKSVMVKNAAVATVKKKLCQLKWSPITPLALIPITDPRLEPIAIENDSIALMQCPSLLSAPTVMGHFYTLNAILQPPTTMRRVDVVLVATPNLASSGLIRRCSTATIENEMMALMQ